MPAILSHSERPILPPEGAGRRRAITELLTLLVTDPNHLVLSNGEHKVPLPAEVTHALRQAVAALADNQAVTVVPTQTLLTTEQAAQLLGVSRPTLIKILDAGEIPYLTPGRHRRIQLTDLLAYRQRAAARTARALEALAQDNAESYAPRPDEFPERLTVE